MTWGVRIVSAHHPRDHAVNSAGQFACGACKHGGADMPGQPYRSGHAVCGVQGVAYAVSYVLTAVDVGADSHMASGNAVLECNGFEPKEESV